MPQHTRRGPTLVLMAATLWGTTGTAQALGPDGISPETGALGRIAGGGAVRLVSGGEAAGVDGAGLAFAFGAGLAWAVYLVAAKALFETHPPVFVAGVVFAGAAGLLGPFPLVAHTARPA